MSGMRHAAGCVSGVSFMGCVACGCIELTGAHEALVAERATDRSVPFFLSNGPDATHRQKWIARPEEAEAL
jgi:hypothetical protein